MIMGCYGIGVGRTLAAVIEQYNDEDGIKWPVSVAPYKAIVIPTKVNDEENMALAEEIYTKLQEAGIEVLIDDRNERPGVKFKDSDLIGIPVRITVGRRASERVVEVKMRATGEVSEITAEEAIKVAIDLK